MVYPQFVCGTLLWSATVHVSVQTFSFFFIIHLLGPPSSPGGQPRNLPCLTAHFVGRDVDVNEIVKKLQTFRMVVLLSIPGMGKTEVGIRVSHLLKQRGDQFVTHIRVESHHRKLVDICREILDRLSSRTWSQTADVISLAKRKLSEQNIPTYQQNIRTLCQFTTISLVTTPGQLQFCPISLSRTRPLRLETLKEITSARPRSTSGRLKGYERGCWVIIRIQLVRAFSLAMS